MNVSKFHNSESRAVLIDVVLIPFFVNFEHIQHTQNVLHLSSIQYIHKIFRKTDISGGKKC